MNTPEVREMRTVGEVPLAVQTTTALAPSTGIAIVLAKMAVPTHLGVCKTLSIAQSTLLYGSE